MAFLDRLSSKIYSRRAEQEIASRKEEAPISELEQIVTPKDRSTLLSYELARKEKKRKAFIIAGAVLILIIIGVIIFFAYKIWRSYKAPSANQIKIEVFAPESIVSGSKITYSINYGNLSNIDWKEAEISLTYPSGFTFSDSSIPSVAQNENNRFIIGDLKKGEQGAFNIEGVIIGDPEKPALLETKISFIPKNSTTRFPKETHTTIRINPLPIDLFVEAPQFASSGEQVRYVVNYQNKSTVTLSDVSIVLSYPSGFNPTSYEPNPSKENYIWQYSAIAPTASGKITVTGNLSGEPAEVKNITVSFVIKLPSGETVTLKRISGETQITKKVLSIKTFLNNKDNINVKPGEKVDGKISFRNDGNIGIGSIIVKAKIEGKAVDLRSIGALEGGRFNSDTNEIIWIAGGAPILAALKPGDGGSLNFSFNVPGKMEVETLQDKNFKVEITATIDSPEIPAPPGGARMVQSSKATAKLTSVMSLETATYYDDGRTGIKSTGSLPPKVGETTTYSIYWRVSNTTNDLKNAKVEGFLPSGVSCTGKSYVTYGANIICDERTGKVSWDLGSISSHTGFLLPVAEAAFQVAIKPGPPDIGNEIVLIKESKATAQDLFTDEMIEVRKEGLSTEDASQINRGRVVP